MSLIFDEFLSIKILLSFQDPVFSFFNFNASGVKCHHIITKSRVDSALQPPTKSLLRAMLFEEITRQRRTLPS